jgi:hypothetical protein
VGGGFDFAVLQVNQTKVAVDEVHDDDRSQTVGSWRSTVLE